MRSQCIVQHLFSLCGVVRVTERLGIIYIDVGVLENIEVFRRIAATE